MLHQITIIVKEWYIGFLVAIAPSKHNILFQNNVHLLNVDMLFLIFMHLAW